jgi:hypothetical protein
MGGDLMAGMANHERAPLHATKDEWLTPPELISALGPFDLDPCSPINRPFDTAARHLTIDDDGLSAAWHGRVWLNPPYGPKTANWLKRLVEHGDGIALLFARTDTDWFHKLVWPKASGLLFLRGRLNFYHVSGQRSNNNAGAPSVLISYGSDNARKLYECSEIIGGKFVPL